MPYGQEEYKDLYVEEQFLGACLLSPDIIPQYVSKLKSAHFYSSRHSQIWDAMVDIFDHGRTVDLVSVSAYGNSDSSGNYLARLIQDCVGYHGVKDWVDEIVNLYNLRRLRAAAGKIAAAAREERNSTMAIARAREILQEVASEDDDDSLISPERQAKILQEFLEHRHETNKSMVSSGYPALDAIAGGGLRRGDLVIIAARTSVGKSTYAENIAEKVAYNGGKVLFCSVEMTVEQMMYRFAVRSGLLSASGLEYGLVDAADKAAAERLYKIRAALPFHLYDAPGATVSSIRGQISRVKMDKGDLDLVVVDYLQLLADASDKDGKEHLRIGKITKSLKHMAREFNCPIILISQLNRNVEYRGGEPKLADLRESGRIEEDADLIIMLWEVEHPDPNGNVTKAKVEKNRQGPKDKLPVLFNKPYFTFAEPYQSERQPIQPDLRSAGTSNQDSKVSAIS